MTTTSKPENNMNTFTNNSATQEGFDTLYASGYPVSGIARALGISEADVKAMCHTEEIAQQVAEQAQEQYDEYEANTTAELDAYLDKQLALQAELAKMTLTDDSMKSKYMKLDELEAEMTQLRREGAAEGQYHDDLENEINDLYKSIGE